MPGNGKTPLAQVSEAAALELVAEMMAVPGKSRQEARIAALIREKLTAAGVDEASIEHDDAHRRIPGGGEVGNLIVRLPSTRRGPRRLLMAHIDTVPLCVGSRPVRDGSIFRARDPHTALGADNRAGAAVVLNTILEIRRQKLD
ncbi:MAG: peptidase M20, partial [Planctomycetes bacterium]|nr:peptidase M20 [Planctomycetota bacterium]